jgi:hypothetical protein
MEVLNFFPFLCLDMLNNNFRALVNTDTDDADFISPSFRMMLKHFLVMCHRSLARRTPSGPEINQQNLAWLVLD